MLLSGAPVVTFVATPDRSAVAVMPGYAAPARESMIAAAKFDQCLGS